MIIEFSKEHKFEGKTYSNVELAIEDLSGDDLMALQKEWRMKTGKLRDIMTKSAMTVALDTEFVLYACSRFSQKPMEFFTSLPVKDFMKVTSSVQNFLLDTE